MKVVFLLDNNEYVEVDPSQLQLRQVEVGQAALGITVNVPVRNEDGTPKVGEDGQAVIQQAFRPFINYPVNLTVAAPAPVEPSSALIPPLNVKEVQLPTKKAKKKGK